MMFIRLLALLVIAGAGLVFALTYGDIVRYLKMRSM